MTKSKLRHGIIKRFFASCTWPKFQRQEKNVPKKFLMKNWPEPQVFKILKTDLTGWARHLPVNRLTGKNEKKICRWNFGQVHDAKNRLMIPCLSFDLVNIVYLCPLKKWLPKFENGIPCKEIISKLSGKEVYSLWKLSSSDLYR